MKVTIEFDVAKRTGTATIGDVTYDLAGVEFGAANDVQVKIPEPGQEFVELLDRGLEAISLTAQIVSLKVSN